MIPTQLRFLCRRVGLCARTLLFLALLANVASAQFLMMPDSTNNRLVLFDPMNGSLVNSNYFGLAAGTPVHALQVGNEIWVSEQIGDRMSRWSLTGVSLGQVGGGATGGLDNIRGMGLINNVVHVTNDGTGNTAPGNSLVMFDTAGTNLGFFATPGSTGPFDVMEHQGSLLVSSNDANDDMHRYTFAGGSLGTFHNSASLNFAEQMDIAANNDILVAGFSSNNVVRMDANGLILSSFPASGARGLWELGNGNIMWTNSAGAHVFDVGTQTSTQVYAGGGRFVDLLVIPEPGLGLCGLAILAMVGARRRLA